MGKIQFRLYVVRGTAPCEAAISNLETICKEHLLGGYEGWRSWTISLYETNLRGLIRPGSMIPFEDAKKRFTEHYLYGWEG